MIFLLQAVNGRGQLIAIWKLNKQSWQKLKQKENYYCPHCGKKVIAKFGTVITPHFAHVSRQSCQLAGETQLHEQGKKDLFEWLAAQQLNPKLEYYLPETKQRADIFLQIGKKKIVLEYQCATIPVEELARRTSLYKQQHITPIWILGINRFNRIQELGISVHKQDVSFIHQYHPQYPLTLYFYCSITGYFIQFQHGIFFTKNKLVGTIKAKPLKQFLFHDIFVIQPASALSWKHIWNMEKQSWLLRTVPTYHFKELKWRQWLYQHQLTIHDLPSYVYLPVTSQYRLKVQPWIWQSELYVKLIRQDRSFQLNLARRIIQHHYLPDTHFPLVASLQDPVEEYFQLLKMRNVLIENDGVFTKRENI